MGLEPTQGLYLLLYLKALGFLLHLPHKLELSIKSNYAIKSNLPNSQSSSCDMWQSRKFKYSKLGSCFIFVVRLSPLFSPYLSLRSELGLSSSVKDQSKEDVNTI